jgi:hypothetical protein
MAGARYNLIISPRSTTDSIFSEWTQRIRKEGPKRFGMFSKEIFRDNFRRLARKTVEMNGTAVAFTHGKPHQFDKSQVT